MERKGSKECWWKAKSSSYESCLQRTCPVLKHNQVSEVFKGSKVHDLEYCGQRNYALLFMSLEMCQLLLALKSYWKTRSDL